MRITNPNSIRWMAVTGMMRRVFNSYSYSPASERM